MTVVVNLLIFTFSCVRTFLRNDVLLVACVALPDHCICPILNMLPCEPCLGSAHTSSNAKPLRTPSSCAVGAMLVLFRRTLAGGQRCVHVALAAPENSSQRAVLLTRCKMFFANLLLGCGQLCPSFFVVAGLYVVRLWRTVSQDFCYDF